MGAIIFLLLLAWKATKCQGRHTLSLMSHQTLIHILEKGLAFTFQWNNTKEFVSQF